MSEIQGQRLIWLAALISILLKIGFGWSIADTWPRGNSATPLNAIAINLATRGECAIVAGTPSIDYEPAYPFLLSVGYRLFGIGWIGPVLLQALLSAVTAGFIYRIGASLSHPTSGFIAAFYFLCYPYLFTYSLSIFDANLVVAILYALLRVSLMKTTSWAKFAMIGILLGLGLLTRSVFLAIIPAIILFLWIQAKGHVRRPQLAKKILVLLITCLAIVAPWLVRNYLYTHTIILSAHGPYGFWQGNNAHSYSLLQQNISLDNLIRMDPPPAIYQKYPIKARPPMEAVLVSKAYQTEVVDFILTHPHEFIKLAGIKLAKLWSWVRNPSSSTPVYGDNDNRQRVYFFSYFPLFLLMPVGFILLWKQDKAIFILFFSLLVFYTGLHMLAMGFTRARIPIDPLLMLLFGLTVTRAWPWLKRITKRRTASFDPIAH